MSKSINTSQYSSANSLSDLLAIFSDVDSSKWAAKRGNQYTATELGDYYYDYLSTQDERQYNEWYYNTYESPSAMVQQYQEAGLNPALMYGSGASTTSTNNSTGYSGVQNGHSPEQSDDFSRLMEVMGLLMQGAQVGNTMSLNKSQKEKNAADAKKASVDADKEAYDLAKQQEADAMEGPDGEVKSSAQLDKELKTWQVAAEKANAMKAFEDAEISKTNRKWMQELVDEGTNIMKLEAEGKKIDNELKQFQSELNEFFRESGYYGWQLKKLIYETNTAKGEATQIRFDTEWLENMPSFLKPAIGAMRGILDVVK